MSEKNIDVMIKKLNFVKDGVIKLPPGFRFQPTEEELVFQYLKCKVFSCPLPASIIPEINVFKYSPWDLPAGDVEGDKFFFCKKDHNNNNGKKINRWCSDPAGYWKTTAGSDKQIISPIFNPIMGIRRTWVYYEGDPQKGSSKTDWIMHEYRLACQATAAPAPPCNWVLCHVSLRTTDNGEYNNYYYYPPSGLSSSSSSTSSSVITEEVSGWRTDNEDTDDDDGDGDSSSSATSYYYFERDGGR